MYQNIPGSPPSKQFVKPIKSGANVDGRIKVVKCDHNLKNPSFKSLQGGMAGLVPDSSLKDFSHTELQVFLY